MLKYFNIDMSTKGFFSSFGEKDVNKMSDSERLAILKSLQIWLSERGEWTEEWLIANGIVVPARTVDDEDHKEEEHVKEQENDNYILDKLRLELRDAIGQMSLTLSEKIDSENLELVRILDKVEDKLRRKESELQGFQEDFRLKATAPFLRQFINLGDMMRRVIDDNPLNVDESAPYLLKQMQRLIESIDCILRDFSIEPFLHNEEDVIFDPYTQQSFEYPTDNPDIDKKIRRTLNPGYVWTLPYIIRAKANGEEHPLKEYRMIFRREQVECFKYIKNDK